MDFTKLEKELSGLMQKDDKYWRENDAKFRAAKQMATYEEFENIVKVGLLFGLEYFAYNMPLLFKNNNLQGDQTNNFKYFRHLI